MMMIMRDAIGKRKLGMKRGMSGMNKGLQRFARTSSGSSDSTIPIYHIPPYTSKSCANRTYKDRGGRELAGNV